MDTTSQAVSPRQLAWLRDELPRWQAQGLVTGEHAALILDQYRAVRRAGLARLMLYLGAAFVGVGVIWLVAANLDQLPPLVRFLVVTAFWLGATAVAEVLGSRSAAGDGPASPTTGAARGLAALAFGAVVFQAAQSLQVPAYEPRLVGLWAAGALLHGYLTRSRMPFFVGLVAGVVWWLWQPMWDEPHGLTVVLVLGAGSVLGASVGVLDDEGLATYAWAWRTVAAAMALVAMFAAAIPGIGSDGIVWTTWLVVEMVVAGVVALAAVLTRRDRRALEPLGATAVLVVATLIAVWTTGTDTSSVDAADWGRAAVSVLAYVVLAVGLVALGTVRDHQALTWMAMAGLVVFTTFQSFAVFAPIVTGAWLFVVLGTLFLGTGFLFDRARRELAQALDTDSPAGTEGAAR